MARCNIYNNIDINDSSQCYQFYETTAHPFSKFYPAKITILNVEYKTVEHFYQCQKFITTDSRIFNMILNSETIESAHLLGQNKKHIRSDWFSVNQSVYYEGQKAKFMQHQNLKQLLLDTKDKHIICVDPVEFWGITVIDDEQQIKGQNNAGKLLEQIRSEFQKDIEEKKNDEEIYSFYEVYTAPFSKFYTAKITIDNIQYLTVEHFYQSQKFKTTDPERYQLILNAETIETAHFLGQNTENIRSDWFDINRDIYYQGQKAKFEQHQDLKQILLETNGKQIRCIDSDRFWGMNANYGELNGQNNSGILLMKIRNEFLMENKQKENQLLNTIDKAIQFLQK